PARQVRQGSRGVPEALRPSGSAPRQVLGAQVDREEKRTSRASLSRPSSSSGDQVTTLCLAPDARRRWLMNGVVISWKNLAAIAGKPEMRASFMPLLPATISFLPKLKYCRYARGRRSSALSGDVKWRSTL